MGVFANNLLIGAASSAGGGGASFDTGLISNSAAFNGSSDNLSRTPSAGTTTRLVIAAWVQRTAFGVNTALASNIASAGTALGNISWFRFPDDDTLDFAIFQSGIVGRKTTTQVFRDTNWYHVMASFDSGASVSASDRIKLFVNGEEVTSFSAETNPGSGETSAFNGAVEHRIGRYTFSSSEFFNGYITQHTMLENQSIQNGDVAVSDFLDTFTLGTNGSQKVPKSDADIITLANAAGSNSWMISFDDSSDLGNDESSNNNDFTVTGLVSGDQSGNTPSQQYMTLSPLVPSVGTLTNGNLTHAGSANFTIGTLSIPKSIGGVWYFEATITEDSGSSEWAIGFLGLESDYYQAVGTNDVLNGKDAVFYTDDNNKVVDGSESSYGSGFSSGNTIGCELDLDDDEVRFLNNSGSSLGTISNAFSSDNISICVKSKGTTLALKVESGDWTHTAPTGAKEFKTGNFTAPANQGIDFFNPVLYTGTGTAIGSGGKAVTGAGFSPGMVWIKNRDAADDHMVFDTERGATKHISTDTEDPEATTTETLSTFDSDGFTVGNNVAVNTNTEDYVSWNWKAATAFSGDGSGGAEGTVASSGEVASSGHFSFFKFTGNSGTPYTVKHGLSVAPEWFVVRCLPNSGSTWAVYAEHAISDPETDVLILNSGGGLIDDSTVWNDTAPTSSVISIGSSSTLNDGTKAMIGYAFASVDGVCHTGSYVGNSDNDGPFIDCGFKPSFLILKWATGGSRSDEAWSIRDNKRSPFNICTKELWANTDDAEQTGPAVDILSNGFKIRSNNSALNDTTATYIYIAMADISGGGTLPPIYGR